MAEEETGRDGELVGLIIIKMLGNEMVVFIFLRGGVVVQFIVPCMFDEGFQSKGYRVEFLRCNSIKARLFIGK